MVSIAQQKKITLTDKEKSSVSKAAKEYYGSLNEAEKKFTSFSSFILMESHRSLFKLKPAFFTVYDEYFKEDN